MLYVIGRDLFRLLLRIVFRFRVEGSDRIPAEGGVLLVANHANVLDPPLVGNATSRPVHFMAKAELFEFPILSWVMPHVKAFPVQRGSADRTAIRTAIRHLQAGHVVGLFPEGTRSRTGQLLPPQGGAGLIALKAAVPVIPIALLNTFQPIGWCRWRLRINRFIVRIGQPLDLSSLRSEPRTKEVVDRASRLMMDGIQHLLEEEHG